MARVCSNSNTGDLKPCDTFGPVTYIIHPNKRSRYSAKRGSWASEHGIEVHRNQMIPYLHPLRRDSGRGPNAVARPVLVSVGPGTPGKHAQPRPSTVSRLSLLYTRLEYTIHRLRAPRAVLTVVRASSFFLGSLLSSLSLRASLPRLEFFHAKLPVTDHPITMSTTFPLVFVPCTQRGVVLPEDMSHSFRL